MSPFEMNGFFGPLNYYFSLKSNLLMQLVQISDLISSNWGNDNANMHFLFPYFYEEFPKM